MRLIDADRLSGRTCVKTCSNCDDMRNGNNVVTNCSEVRFRFLRMIEEAPTVEAVPSVWFKLLCKQLEDRCPPDRECIVSNYEGTCEECWKEWCKSVLDER